MALTGENFWTSAVEAFKVVMFNKTIYVLVEGLGGLFIMVGTAAISLTSTYIGYMYVKKKPEIMDKLVGLTFPCLVFFMCTWTIGAIFMSIYGVAQETIL